MWLSAPCRDASSSSGKGISFRTTSTFTGLTPTLAHLVESILHQPLTDVDIPEELLKRELPGDYLYRPDASQLDLAKGLSAILSAEFGNRADLMFDDVEKPVYVARGELQINEARVAKRDDRPQIELNGGPHTGDNGEMIGFGNLAKLLNETSDYIGIKIVDEAKPSETPLAWSKRWYDLADTPQEKRFKLDPDKVLQLVHEQTGITFEKQTSRVKLLTLIERD